MIQLAIIGPTASGKSDLAIKIAKKIDAYILSIDSLSIYKEIDIVSAKPSKEELEEVRHFGINLLNPDEYFSVEIFINLYKEVVTACKRDKKKSYHCRRYIILSKITPTRIIRYPKNYTRVVSACKSKTKKSAKLL